jgi:hypothetical protein
MADDIRQLVEPIHVAVPIRDPRGRITGHRLETHPPLLDQLRAATTPGATGTRGPERRPMPESRPPLRLDPLDALAGIYVDLTAWHTRMNLPSPARDDDWWKTALRQLVGGAPNLAPSIADQLAHDVHDWWRTAAVHSPWQPADLLHLR